MEHSALCSCHGLLADHLLLSAARTAREPRDRARLLPWLMLPVGAEVGFRRRALVLLAAPRCCPDAACTGAGGRHGHCIRLSDFIDWKRGALVGPRRCAVAYASDCRRRGGRRGGNHDGEQRPEAPFALRAVGLAAGDWRYLPVSLWRGYCSSRHALAGTPVPLSPMVALLMRGFAQKPTLQT